ncbi:MAG: universal stress protein [Kordiimonadaceae bacterium]|nr:universal stress protein [Kordiimonadaceae bacterium]
MKSILLPLAANMGDHAAIHMAAHLATCFGAAINGLYIRPDPVGSIAFMGEGLTADMMQDLCDATTNEGLAQAARCQGIFNEIMAESGIGTDKSSIPTAETNGACARWQIAVGDITCHVGRKARTADVAICPQPAPEYPDLNDILQGLIYRSGRPVFMIPSGTKHLQAKPSIVIAWNGSAECARAIGAALPFLRIAEAITLLQVGNIKDERPTLDDAAQYLGDHGLKATTLQIEPSGQGVGADILSHKTVRAAQMIVAGAFSHSRWREMILGGVTSHLVEHSDKPLFMSH